MRALGIDWGERRVGVAVSDSQGTIAVAYCTIDHADNENLVFGEIKRLVEETTAEVIVLGLPTSMNGGEGRAAESMRQRKGRLEAFIAVPVELIDERLTTVSAHELLKEAGLKAKDRKTKVDEVAASILLQSWLDSRIS